MSDSVYIINKKIFSFSASVQSDQHLSLFSLVKRARRDKILLF